MRSPAIAMSMRSMTALLYSGFSTLSGTRNTRLTSYEAWPSQLQCSWLREEEEEAVVGELGLEA